MHHGVLSTTMKYYGYNKTEDKFQNDSQGGARVFLLQNHGIG